MSDGLGHRLPAQPSAHPLRLMGDVVSFTTGFAMTLLVVLFSIAMSLVSRLHRPLVTLTLLAIASIGLIAMQLRVRR